MELSKARWKKLQFVLDKVLDLPQKEQLQVLENECGENPQLFEDAKSLLEASEQAPAFLERSALELSLVKELKNRKISTSSLNPQTALSQAYCNKQVGPYILRELIGQGGMGSVYRAERNTGGFEQQVAIKLLSVTQGRKIVFERFQREQAFLAKLNHPNIARLLDGGLTFDGTPYFVLEYVEGLRIDRYCDQRKLNIKQRLKLFLQIFDVLSFSHKNLIVHRDVKPSNILVTKDGDVKLLDFGIAKFLSLDKDLNATQTAAQLMTPGFAAPEQLLNQQTTVATDVYQLGLVLYKLLTGTQAYHDNASSFIDITQRVCNDEPTLPSKLVKCYDVDELQEIAKLRSCDGKHLAKILSGDLDAILLKSLQNKSEERYSSVESFKADIIAYFNHMPTSASNISVSYQLKKYLRRHWRSLSVVSTLVVLLSIYAITVTFQANQIERALQASEVEKEKAQQISDFMINLFKYADPNVNAQGELFVTDLLEQGYQGILAKLGDSPQISAHMLTNLGEIYFSLGDYNKSQEVLESALRVYRENKFDKSLGMANTLTQLGITYTHTKKLKEAQSLFDESLSIHEQYLINNSTETEEYAETHTTYGELYRVQGDYTKAREYFIKSVSILKGMADSDKSELLVALNGLAAIEYAEGNYQDSTALMSETIEIHEKVLGPKHSYFSLYLYNYSMILIKLERLEEASRFAKRALDIQKTVLSEDHPYQAFSLQAIAMISRIRGDFDLAETQFKKALDINLNSLEQSNFVTARLYLRTGEVLLDLEKFTEAKTHIKQALKISNELSMGKRFEAECLGLIAELYHTVGEYRKASQEFKQAIAQFSESSLEQSHVQVAYARLLIDLKNGKQATLMAGKALDTRGRLLSPNHRLIAEAKTVLGLALSDNISRKIDAIEYMAKAKLLQSHKLYQVGLRQQFNQRALQLVNVNH